MRRFIIILVIAVAAIIFLVSQSNPLAHFFSAIKKVKDKPLITNLLKTMLLTSPSFNHQEFIPQKFTCDGGDINPELQIQNVPPEAKSLALIVDDPDATGRATFTHWLIWNIDPGTTLIKQESKPPGSIEGKNDFPQIGYGGPCPPRGAKPHRYFFKLYALSSVLNLKEGTRKAELEAEIQKYLLARAELVGLFSR